MSGSSSRPPKSDEAARSTARPPKEETADANGIDVTAAVLAAQMGGQASYGPPGATAKIRPFQLAEALARLSADPDPASSRPKVDPPSSRSKVDPTESNDADDDDLSVPTPLVEITPQDLSALLAKTRSPSLPAIEEREPPRESGEVLKAGAPEAITSPPPTAPPPTRPSSEVEALAAKAEPPIEVKVEEPAPLAVEEKPSVPDEEVESPLAAKADEPLPPGLPAANPSRAAEPTPRRRGAPFSPLILLLVAAGVAMMVHAYVTANR